MPKRIRDLDIEAIVALDSRLLIVKDPVTEEEVTITVEDFIASLPTVSPSAEGSRNYCYNPEFRIAQIRGEGDLDAVALGPLIDTANTISRTHWFSDGWTLEEIGFQSVAQDLEISHVVADSLIDSRRQRLELTVDDLPGGVPPATDNLVKLSFLLDNDERKALRGNSFTFSFVASMPRAGVYTVYAKDAFSVFVTSFTIAIADTEQTIQITIPANTQNRTGPQDTFIADKYDSLEIGIVLTGTKGGLNTENISAVGSDGYSTTAAASVIDYFIKTDQETAMAATDVYAFSEIRISKNFTSYAGYDYIDELRNAERYFQKSTLQLIPAGRVYIVFEDGNLGVPRTDNIGTVRQNLQGGVNTPRGLESATYDIYGIQLNNPLKTHDNNTITVAVNPVMLSDSTLISAQKVNRSISGIYERLLTSGSLNRITTDAFILQGNAISNFEQQGPFLPPEGEAFTTVGNVSPYPASPGNRVPGWLIGAIRSSLNTISQFMLPQLPTPKNVKLNRANLTTQYGSLGTETVNPYLVLYQWFVQSLPDTPGSTITPEPTFPP